MPTPSPGNATTQAAPENPADALDGAGFGATPASGPVRAMTDRLTARGLTVHTRADEDCWRLKLTCTGKAASVTIDDDQYVTCEYSPKRNRPASPGGTARIVTRILGTAYTSPHRQAHLYQGATLIGAVGRYMRARGMTVTLDVIEDDETCTVFAGIVITSPARPERGTVILDDDGWIHWECDAGDIPGGLADLADTLADILTPESRPTARDLLAVAYSACLRAITPKQTRNGSPKQQHPGPP